MRFFLIALFACIGVACSTSHDAANSTSPAVDSVAAIQPTLITDLVTYDSDDPAIWINREDPSTSLIIGTDKGGDAGDGALFVFDLNGKEIKEKTVKNIKRPNNVDVAYGLQLAGNRVDIAVCTERNTNSIRIFSLPDMKAIDNGGIPVFEGDSARAPMGIALYTSPDNKIYALVGRKTGKSGEYIWQYELTGNANETVTGRVVRKFGDFSGKHEIESIAVDNESGYVYYSDEGFGVRKYLVHPDSSTRELAAFGTTGFTDNHEGISIYKTGTSTGYIIVSDQQANTFRIFPREGSVTSKHDHPLLKVIKLSTIESDGNEVTSFAFPQFPSGFFIAMSDDKTFQLYDWKLFGMDSVKSAAN